jgi:putative transposase
MVFYTQSDRRVYLDLLQDGSRLEDLNILAYCLMRNHIHLIAIPAEAHSLAVVLRRVHGRYAQYLNARRQRTGHLWQNRFYSCPVENSQHLWTALRYVERNPVRAGVVAQASDYKWSSATAHLSGKDRQRCLDMGFWAQAGGAERWTALLAEPDDGGELKRLRSATYAGKPYGGPEFKDKLQQQKKPAPSRTVASGRLLARG